MGHDEEFEKKLQKDIFPEGWVNPKPIDEYDLVVIGGGPGGMTAASIAKGMGAKVALVEKEHFGGECLSYGCIPSKAFLQSSRVAAAVRRAKEYGLEVEGWKVNFPAVMERVHHLQTVISPHDSADRFKKLGVDVFLNEGHFDGDNSLEVGGQRIFFKKAVIATGTQPIPLEAEGLAEADYWTNQDIFKMDQLPKRMAFIGGGPICCELSQAFLRFGSQVTLIARGSNLLPKDDPIASERLKKAFEDEGMKVFTDSVVQRVEKKGKEKILYLKSGETIVVDDIFVSIGRKPVVEGMNLEKGGISFDPQEGILTDEYLQTSNPNVYAAGDVTSKFKFTHISQELSKMAVLNALNGNKVRKESLIVPWCTFSDPEVAQIGLSELEIKKQGLPVEIVMVEMASIDRAILDGDTLGFLKIMVKENSDQILGVTMMAAHAGDMISEMSVVMNCEKGLTALSKAIHPFPTQAQVLRTAVATILKRRSDRK
jgi:pyruvate/2-oxoglutarate dehydrogenase complex dihydrolipoamide dehydrogenase (E3) component